MIFQFRVYKNAFNFALPSWCADSYHHFDRAFDTPLLMWVRPLSLIRFAIVIGTRSISPINGVMGGWTLRRKLELASE
jgi:hypothetical protein